MAFELKELITNLVAVAPKGPAPALTTCPWGVDSCPGATDSGRAALVGQQDLTLLKQQLLHVLRDNHW